LIVVAVLNSLWLAVSDSTAYGSTGRPLSGVVLDGETLDPVAGASVAIDGTELSSTTDATGRFELADAPDSGVIGVRVVANGYDVTDEQVDLDEVEREALALVVLRPNTAGETIEVEARAPLAKRSPGHTELEREELVKLPGARGDALEVVRSLPGVASAVGRGFSPGNLVIRGAAPEDSIYLLDGVEIPLVYHFGGLQTVLPAEMIDDIEFLPGGFDVDNGRATGGIVHIHTRPSMPDHLTGFAELSFINVAGQVQGPLWKKRNVSFALGFRRSMVDALLPAVIPDDANLTFTTMPQYYDAEARLDWVPNEHNRVAAFGLFSLDRIALVSDNENAQDPNLTGRLDAEESVGVGIATWHYHSKELDNTAAFAVSKLHMNQKIGDSRHLDIVSPTVALRESMVWRAHPRATLRLGGDLLVNRGDFDVVMPLPPQEGMPSDPNFTTDPVTTFDDVIDDVWASAYVASDLKPLQRLTVTPGVRLDHYDRLDATTVSPRLAARLRLSPKWMVRAAVGEYTRPLTGAEWAASGLDPERAEHYVAGADYQIADGVSASASGFYTDSRDLVVQDPSLIENDALEAYVNRGTGRAYGAELIVRAKLANFFGWITYTASHATRKDSPMESSRLFDHDQTHNVIAVGSYKWGAWTFGGRWQLTTGEPYTPVVGSQYLSDVDSYRPTYGRTNSDRLETAHQLDLRVDRTWQFDTWTLSGYLDVSNVYANPRTYGYQYNFDYTEREKVTDLPILPAIGIRGAF